MNGVDMAPRWIRSDEALPGKRGYYMARWENRQCPAWFDSRLKIERGQWVLIESDTRMGNPVEWLYDGTPEAVPA